MRTQLRRLMTTGALSIALGACQGQADPQYKGEKLASISGTIESSSTNLPSTLVAGLQWHWASPDNLALTVTYEGRCFTVVHAQPDDLLTTVPVQGDFPSKFTLDVFSPPPADALDASGSNVVATAQIVVFDTATKQVWGSTEGGESLVYYPNGYTPQPGKMSFCGCDTSQYDTQLSAGYHLMQPMQIPDTIIPGSTHTITVAAPGGFATPLSIKLTDPASLPPDQCPTIIGDPSADPFGDGGPSTVTDGGITVNNPDGTF